jgi:hypothetical protein
MKNKNATRKKEFVRKLAEFLAGNPAAKSIALEMEQKSADSPHIIRWAHAWAELRGASPLFGYQTVEEAEAALEEFLK